MRPSKSISRGNTSCVPPSCCMRTPHLITWRKRCAPPAAPLGLRHNNHQIMPAFFILKVLINSGCLGYGTCAFGARRLHQARYMQYRANYICAAIRGGSLTVLFSICNISSINRNCQFFLCKTSTLL